MQNIETTRLILRKFNVDDFDALHSYEGRKKSNQKL